MTHPARHLRVGLAILLAALVAFPCGASASIGSATQYYVSLGDSLAASYQPNGVYDEGYAEQLHSELAAAYSNLRLVKLGCGGESTVSMRFGSQDPGVAASCGPPSFYRHRYAHKTQLDEAVQFLQAHKHQVALVTIDIGANDVLGPSGIDSLLENLPPILAELRAAAGPGVPIAGMSYFDPFLPLAWEQGGLLGLNEEIARTVAFNDLLEGMYAAEGMSTADVESAFSVTDTTPVGGTPFAVLRACEWTWMCASGDIHANTAGYGVIADAFLDVLGPDHTALPGALAE
jgi:lysophospholipase L1-like esterase